LFRIVCKNHPYKNNLKVSNIFLTISITIFISVYSNARPTLTKFVYIILAWISSHLLSIKLQSRNVSTR
jgi:hypothetical protein